MSLHIKIPGPPQPQERGRIRRYGERCVSCKQPRFSGIMDPPKSAAWKKHAAAHMLAARRKAGLKKLSDIPLRLDVLAVFPCPKSRHRKNTPARRIWKTAKNGDASNILKAVEDAGNGILWDDDCLIAQPVVQSIVAAQDEEPAVYVRVTRLSPYDVPTTFAAGCESAETPPSDASVGTAGRVGSGAAS